MVSETSIMGRTIEVLRGAGTTEPFFKNSVREIHPLPPPDIDLAERGLLTLDAKSGKYVVNQVAITEYLRDMGYRFVDDVVYRFDGRYLSPVSKKELEDEVIAVTRTVTNPPMVSCKVKSDILSYWSSIAVPKRVKCTTSTEELECDYSGWLIPFENGIYKVDEDRLVPFTPDVLFTSHIHADFVPNCENEEVEAIYRNILGDEDTLRFFYQAVGYTLYSDVLNPPAIFVLQGPGETGKSAILTALECLIGKDKAANLSPAKLSEQFGPYRLKGMVANLCDEAGNRGGRFVKINGDMLKAISAGHPWDVERKYHDVEKYSNEAKLWFAANNTPDLGDTSSGMMRRVFIFPCTTKQNPENRIYSKMCSSEGLSYLAFKALEEFLRFKLSGQAEFVESDRMLSMKELFHTMDSLSDYISEGIAPLSDREAIRDYLDRKAPKEIYQEYVVHARENNWDNPLKKGTVVSRLCTEYGLGVKTFFVRDGLKNTSYSGFYKQ